MKEIQEGWFSDLTPIGEIVMRAVSLAPRFSADGARGGGEVRSIDDFRAIGIDDVVETEGTDVPENLDALLVMANFYKKIDPAVSLQDFSVDPQRAYKNIPMLGARGSLRRSPCHHQKASFRWRNCARPHSAIGLRRLTGGE